MSQANQIRSFILRNLPTHSQDIVAYATNHFGVTRTTIHRHLATLIKQNKILKSGTTKQVAYYLITQRNRKYKFSVKEGISESTVWDKYLQPQFEALPASLAAILHYGFTEIFNNALEHAQASHIEVSLTWQKKMIVMSIKDNGIGVFQRINNYFHFGEYRECLLHLTKGKLTTDPSHHTGEGLFFTSRSFDHFSLIANGICFQRDNKVSDWSVQSTTNIKGTEVVLEISQESKRDLTEIFNQYTEDSVFNKTDLLVDLSLLEGERLISRSQAKRLFAKIGPFKSVTLDFAKVVTVGQGFADEVFRVFPSKHPTIHIHYINANNDVEFMIKRALP